MKWKKLKSEIVYKNNFFEIEQDQCQKPDGSIVEEYYIVKRADAIIIAAFTEKMELVMITQYRHPVKSIDYEIPAGHINPDEKNIEDAVKRELLEETGYCTGKLISLGSHFTESGLMDSTLYFFIGFNAKKIRDQNLDPNEAIDVKITPWPEALKLLETGKVKDLGSATGILLAKEYLEKNAPPTDA